MFILKKSLELRESKATQSLVEKILLKTSLYEADSAIFDIKENELKIDFYKKEEKAHSVCVHKNYFQLILNYFRERVCLGPSRDGLDYGAVCHKEGFLSLVRTSDKVILLDINSDENSKSFKINNIKKINLSLAVDQLGIMEYTRKDFLNISLNTSGLILVSSPQEGSVRPTVASILSISGGHYVGSLEEASTIQIINKYSKHEVIIASITAHDSTLALKQLLKKKINLNHVKLAGVICNEFVRLACQSCMQNTKADGEILSNISPKIRVQLAKAHFSNEGCQKCAEKGYQGYIGIQSIICGTRLVSDHSSRMTSISDVCEQAIQNGTRPLFYDAIHKYLNRVSTLSSIFHKTPEIPKYYQSMKESMLNNFDKTVENNYILEATAESISIDTSNLDISLPHVLVVDKDPDQRKILELTLLSSKYNVYSTNCCEEALSLIASKIPDIILCDLDMPNINGENLLKNIRQNKQLKDVPVMILTGKKESDRRLHNLGANAVCSKSLNRQKLLKQIKILIHQKNSQSVLTL